MEVRERCGCEGVKFRLSIGYQCSSDHDGFADAPPRKAESHIAVTPGYFADGRFFSPLPLNIDRMTCKSVRPSQPSSAFGLVANNEAERGGEPIPMKRPVGLSVQVHPNKDQSVLFVTDQGTEQIWQASFSRSTLRLMGA